MPEGCAKKKLRSFGDPSHTKGAGKHPPVHDIRDLIFFRFSLLAAANDRLGQRWSRKHSGLSLLEWRVLGMVRAMGPARFGKIAQALYIDGGHLSRLLKSLVRRNLVQVTEDKSDKRAKQLSTTPEGRRLHDRLLGVVLQPNELFLRRLTTGEISQLTAILDKLQDFTDGQLARWEPTP